MKRLFVLFMIAVMTLTAASCGQNDGKKEESLGFKRAKSII